MRLIDADVLMKEFAGFVKESNNSDFADAPTWNDAVSLLGSAPTAKAVPVEYIYRRATEFSKMYSEKDLFTAKEIGLALTLIARDWEVENDKDI